MSSSSSTDLTDVLCEFLQVVLHNILFIRKLYPSSIFEPRKKYGVVVQRSMHEDVNNYIDQCLKAVHYHAKKKKLRFVYFCIETSGGEIVEKFVFDILTVTNYSDDPFLVELEQAFRKFILQLHGSCNYLRELSDDHTFSIRIGTSAYTSLEFNQKPANEDFPWIETSEVETSVKEAELVPVQTVATDYLTIQLYIETATS